MRQRSQDCEPAELHEEAKGGVGLGRGAVPQRLLGSSPCHCVTSSKLAIKTAADATKGLAVQCTSPTKHSPTPLMSTTRPRLPGAAEND